MVGYLEIYMSNNNLHKRNLPVPFFSQRQVTYVWQERRIENNQSVLVSNTEVSLAWASCNILGLCMILHYYGITDDSPNKMLEKFFSTIFKNPNNMQQNLPNDFRHEKEINTDNLKRGPHRLQLWDYLQQFPHLVYNVPTDYIIRIDNEKDIYTLNDVQNDIADGNPVMFSFGPLIDNDDRTGDWQKGHIAVIRGFTENDNIILNDPYGDPTFATGILRPPWETRMFGEYNYSIGRGDNTIILKRELERIIMNPIFQAIVIRYPHIWAFPFRQYTQQNGINTSRSLTFSDHTIDNKTNQNMFRASQIQSMMATEVLNNAGYPISANRFWHDGIHINGEGAVYAIGPGRIVAARILDENRIPTSGSNNFILVRHRVKIDNQIKEFYSHYMHLAPVDIARRIREQISEGQSEREKDWLDQIITYIRPKCAIIRIRSDPDDYNSAYIKLNGKERENGPQVYYRNNQGAIVPTSPVERLANRAIIYFCPVNPLIRERLETINPDEELQGEPPDSFYDNIDNIVYYRVTSNNTRYYSFYHMKHLEGNNVSWEIRYVRANNNYDFQTINTLEFIYYRRLLAKLLKGEITTFAREEIRRKNIISDQTQLFEGTLLSVFPEEGIFTPMASPSVDFKTAYDTGYRDIQRYYTNLINEIRKMENNTDTLNRLMNHLTERIFDLGKTLLAIPDSSLNLTQEWFTRLVRDQDSTYREILRLAYPDNNIVNNYIRLIEKLLQNTNNSEIDYYFEVNKNTKLGMTGRFKRDNNIIHFEIFADNANIIHAEKIAENWNPNWDSDNRKFINVQKFIERNDFFNAKKIIKNLRQRNFLRERDYFKNTGTEDRIRNEEISNFFNDTEETKANISLQYAIVQHLHSHATLTADIWKKIIANSYPQIDNLNRQEIFENYLSYKWFSKEVGDELNLPWNSIFKKREGVFAAFYHPVRFLAWLDEYLIDQANNAH
jgi:hypothetical protein